MKQDSPITPEEERRAYEVLAQRFGFSAAYIKAILKAHFETPSEAGNEHMQNGTQAHEKAETDTLDAWDLEDIRHFLASLDHLRIQGLLPPLMRSIDMDYVKKNKRGDYYVASYAQLQQELELQRRLSIDPDGNLVQKDGTIIKARWLQSFGERD